MLKTGSKDLDGFLRGYKREINCVYGPAATGKTTICLLAAIELAKNNKKVVFVDTENGFNIDRISQIAGWNYISILDKILLIKVNSFEDQCKKIENLERVVGVDLIIVDSISNFYRKEIHKNAEEINKKLVKQMEVLNKLSRKTCVILTSQVYEKFDKGVSFLGGKIIENFSKRIIELKKEPRNMLLKKPEGGNFIFEIADCGIVSS